MEFPGVTNPGGPRVGQAGIGRSLSDHGPRRSRSAFRPGPSRIGLPLPPAMRATRKGVPYIRKSGTAPFFGEIPETHRCP